MAWEDLKYYMHDGPAAFRFELAGNLNQEGARRLDQDWRTASSVIGDRLLIVDITYLTDADDHGRELLARWFAEGARLIAGSEASRDLAESILQQSLPDPVENPPAAAAACRTWLPFAALFGTLIAALVFPGQITAATLKPETIAAWNEYISTVKASHQNRVKPGGSFLWTFENAERAARVRGGETVVAPISERAPEKVPGGLIHHWIGAKFIPNATADDVLAVARDYDHYKNFYQPSVLDSKTIARTESDDRFSMVLMNTALFLKMALDADYRSNNVRVDDHRIYTISKTTRVQEIEEYGRAGQHRIAEGQGGGYIWKLYSIARFEERDHGVYVELEAIALSRDIPAMARFFVDPIVRRVSRNSLLTSLQQTQQACESSKMQTAERSKSPRRLSLNGQPSF